MKLSETAIRRPVTTTVFYLALIVIGLFSLSRLAIDLIPDISYPVIAVYSTYEGVAPEEIEENLTRHLENAASSVANVKKVTSSSREGQSVVTVEFEWGTDMSEAAADLREKLDLIKELLPDDATQPVIYKFDPSQIPVMVLTIEGQRDQKSLRYLADQDIRTHLEQVDGVAQVTVWGGREREIQVELSRTALASYGISVDQIASVLSTENLNLTGGTVSEGKLVYSLRTLGKLQNLNQIRRVVVANRNGIPIYLENLAAVIDGFEESKVEIRSGKTQAVIAMIQKQSGTNTVQITKKVRKKIAELKGSLPADIKLIEIYTPSDFIEVAIANVGKAAWQGGLLAIIVIFLFLRSLPITLIISVTIPLSLIITFIFMYFSNLTLNMMSLGGLALGIGMLVDNSIVVLENVFRYRENGTKAHEAAVLATQEMAMPMAASTLTTVVVFLPLVLFIKGLAAELFKDMAFTITFSLFASLLVALTVIPMLSSLVKKVAVRKKMDSLREVEKELEARGRFMSGMDRVYHGILRRALSHRWLVVLIIFLIFAASLFLIPVVGVIFMPTQDEGWIIVDVETPVGSTLEVTREVIDRFEDIVSKVVPERKKDFIQIGRTGDDIGQMRENIGSFWLYVGELDERQRSIDTILEDLRSRTQGIAGATIRMTKEMGGMGGDSGLKVSLRGYDLKQGKKLAEDVKKLMEGVPNINDVAISREEGLPEYRIVIDRDRAAQYGLSVSQVGNSIRKAFAGQKAASIVLEGEEVDIMVRLRPQDRVSHRDLALLNVDSPAGQQIPLANLVRLEKGFGPVQIQREGQQRVVYVEAKVSGDMRKAVSQVQDRMRGIAVPAGFTVVYGGSWEDLQETLMDLLMVFLLSLLLVYLIMAAQFESFYDPFLIMFTLPMTLIGVIWIHVITGIQFSAISGIGVVILAGVVVNNGIILVDYTNILRKRGYPMIQAVTAAGRTRLRPILMTVLTTLLALLPMAVAGGSGRETEAPLALTLIGGLSVSTVFTLVLIPVLYASFEVWKAKRKARRKERHG